MPVKPFCILDNNSDDALQNRGIHFLKLLLYVHIYYLLKNKLHNAFVDESMYVMYMILTFGNIF